MLELVKAMLGGSLGRDEGVDSLRALGNLRKLLLHKVKWEGLEVEKVSTVLASGHSRIGFIAGMSLEYEVRDTFCFGMGCG